MKVLIESLCPLNCGRSTHPAIRSFLFWTFECLCFLIIRSFALHILLAHVGLAGSNFGVSSLGILLQFPGEGTL